MREIDNVEILLKEEILPYFPNLFMLKIEFIKNEQVPQFSRLDSVKLTDQDCIFSMHKLNSSQSRIQIYPPKRLADYCMDLLNLL